MHAVTTNLLGVNLVTWDNSTGTSQTESLEEAAGIDMFRIPGGSGADGWHFNSSTGTPDYPEFLSAIDAVNGTGLVTTDYGSGSPQEAAAELAYTDGSTTDTTSLNAATPTGIDDIEWVNGAWQTENWDTVGFWASLRGASPITPNDGLNFLRVNHPAAWTNITYWEIGNEEYGSWETDNHGTAGPNGSTGNQHDPATYAKFAAEFAALAAEIQSKAGLPMVSIGIDSGNPNGNGDNNWTKNVLADGYTAANNNFVPGFISDHNYVQGPGGENDSNLLNSTVTQSGNIDDWATRYSDYETSLDATVGSTNAATVKIMATEYNSVYSNPGKQSTSLVNGLFTAESLGILLDSNYVAGINWDLRNGWGTGNNNSNLLYGWRRGRRLWDPGRRQQRPQLRHQRAVPRLFRLAAWLEDHQERRRGGFGLEQLQRAVYVCRDGGQRRPRPAGDQHQCGGGDHQSVQYLGVQSERRGDGLAIWQDAGHGPEEQP